MKQKWIRERKYIINREIEHERERTCRDFTKEGEERE